MNHVQLLLCRLHSVKGNGPYRADCPCNHDKLKGSLSIKVTDDGHILLHCHAGHGAHDVLSALGLGIEDLYPERLKDRSPAAQAEANAHWDRKEVLDALAALTPELVVIHAAACDLEAGTALPVNDIERLKRAREMVAAVHLVACRKITEASFKRLEATQPRKTYRNRNSGSRRYA
jgi:hypothetical protein